MKPRSLRTNLILWFTLIFTLVLLLSDYATYTVLQDILVSQWDSNLISMATLEGAAFKEGNALDLETINNQPQPPARFINQFIQVIDEAGAVVKEHGLAADTGPLIDRAQLASAFSGQVITASRYIESTPVRVAAVATERDGKPFVIAVGMKAETMRGTTSEIALILLAIDLIAIAISIAGGYMIIGKALRPVDHIAMRAHQIGEGNLRQRLQYIDSSSEMVHLTTVLNEMLDKLQRLFESQKQFVQDASHELRSPLAALICRLEVALRQNRSDEEYRQVVADALEDAARLKTLADDLFLLARADSNNLSMELREVSLSDVLAAVHEQLKPLAESLGIEFTFVAQPDCKVYADRARIHQAFRNIAENALKYTPRGGRVTIRIARDGDRIRADIEDTGIGIPIEEQSNIFRRFYRVDHARSRSDGGTGLGLAICDQIIRAHHGEIEVESAPGRGSRFTVYLTAETALIDE
ncbi:MAG TPA: ATP-binding protein [Blastocatellia bacterium]|nr:ATP-binding protein [Blastocatellia bacterium]